MKKTRFFQVLLSIVLALTLSTPAFAEVTTGAAYNIAPFSFGSTDFQGLGTSESPYLIRTESDLKKITGDKLGAYFKLMNDIALTTPWTPIGITKENPFSGTFDGNGHKITNLYFDNNSMGLYLGLFGCVENAVIKNLGVEFDFTLKDRKKGVPYFGAVVGFATDSQISGCYAKGDIEFGFDPKDKNSYGFSFGAVVGYAIKCEINRCYSQVNLKLNDWPYMGLIAGYLENTMIAECYSTGSTEAINHKVVGSLGGIIGYNYQGEFNNCFSTADLTSSENVDIGGIVGQLMTTINKSYSTSKINGNSQSGGIAGTTYNSYGRLITVNNCVALNPIITSYNKEALYRIASFGRFERNLAYDDMILQYGTYPLFVKSTNPSENSKHGKNTTITDLKKQSTYEALGWDFDNVWTMTPSNQGFPTLKHVPFGGDSTSPPTVDPSTKLEAPKFKEYTFSWDYVPNAISYNVSVNGVITSTNENKIVLPSSNALVKVQAVAGDVKGPWSKLLKITESDESIASNSKDPNINIFSEAYRKSAETSAIWGAGYEGDKALDNNFTTRWATPDRKNDPVSLTIEFKDLMAFNEILISEFGSKTKYFKLEYLSPETNDWTIFKEGFTIGNLTINDFGEVVTTKVRLTITKDPANSGGVSIYEFQAKYK